MRIGFVHLSDIHFGQERKDGSLWINNDVRESLIDDVAQLARALEGGRAAGIIVTGDISYSGVEEQYKSAGAWLDRVAEAAGCLKTDIQLVPGNHDIDWSQISELTGMMLQRIATEGDGALDKFLASDQDRETLFRRFGWYVQMAEAYRCPLDRNAELSADRVLELAPGRSLRFARLNSALISSKKDVKGTLLLGARQRVLTSRAGEELVVLSHHPLDWLQDSADARRYIQNRARVFISGHEHNPAVRVETVTEGCDILLIAAGATVPPAHEDFNYCFNMLEFSWREESDALSVRISTREWIDEQKRFGARSNNMEEVTLACPNFRRGDRRGVVDPVQPADEIRIEMPSHDISKSTSSSDLEPPMLLLRFFRELTPAQRIEVLVALEALPTNWNGVLSESFLRSLVELQIRSGHAAKLRDLMAALTIET